MPVLENKQRVMWAEAEAILRGNDLGGYTVPTRGLYPYQWLWDSAFVAMGWRHVDEQRAWQELETLMMGQWPTGMLPHITFHQVDDTYFPGPDIWRSPQQSPSVSGITQPTVMATALWDLYRNASNQRAFEPQARAIFQSLLRHHRWLYEARDPWNLGLVALLHPWESGRDNCPTWDRPLSRVVPVNVPPFKRVDITHVNAEHRPSDEDYARFVYLLLFLRNGGYTDPALYQTAPFCVVDTGFNSILLRANRDLLAVARALGEPDAEIGAWVERTEKGFDRLRDGKGGFVAGLDIRADEALEVPVTSRFLTLWGGAATPAEADVLAEQFRASLAGSAYWAATTAPSAPAFQPKCYWRGPIWGIINWMLAEGFESYGLTAESERLRADTLGLVETAGFYEYFHPLTGEGLGGPSFSWTAATVLQLLARK